MLTTQELLDDVQEMLALSDDQLEQLELTRSTLENQLQSLLSDLSEEYAFYACR